jgi:adenosylmethionine-8-amino-7-oxononanoate aminotransferase
MNQGSVLWVTLIRCYHGKHNGKLGLHAGKTSGYQVWDGFAKAVGHLRLPDYMSKKKALDWATEDKWKRVHAAFPELPEFKKVKPPGWKRG